MSWLISRWKIPDNIHHRVDVIVAMGTGIRSDGSLSNLSKAVTQKAIELYKNKFAPNIIFTGGFTQNNITEAEAMRDYAIKRGIPKNNIFLEVDSVSTPTNVSETQKILKKKKFKSVLVVAQYVHIRRVIALFRRMLGNNYKLYWISAFSKYDNVPGQKRLSSENRFLLWEMFWIGIYKLQRRI
jgi:uncharacterized SAM-binding protein YcdF (DUF218 family)